ncbi:MAG: CoA transferase [Chloroflexi bacterium]|nr:CoA transferase [Chloroflexota bacterium]
MNEQTGPLAGVRVLDLTHHIAGPFCTKLLADAGADVVKVERPGLGDGLRSHEPFAGDEPGVERSGLFFHLNTSKRSVTLNFKTREGLAMLEELARRSDVLVENFRPGALDRAGLGADRLEALNPRLVVASISNFGQDGPYRDYKAIDAVFYALGGWMYSMGAPDKPPLYPSGSYAQYIAGLFACLGILPALYWADLAGEGQRVDVSILEAVLSVLVYDTVEYSYSGIRRGRFGHRWSLGSVAGCTASVQPCKDGYVGVYLGHGEERWQLFVGALLERPDLLDDPRFAAPQGRVQNVDELEAILREWLQEHTSEEIFHRAQELRLLFSTIPTTRDLAESPHWQARGYFQELEHPVLGRVTLPGPPFRLSATPLEFRRPAPLLGQHNAEVYGELGYAPEDLVRLRELGVI